jgi:putative endonuclease
MPFYVYILQMGDGRLYVGQTGDLERRFKDHKEGLASATTQFYGKEKCIYVEGHPDRISAITREKQIKKWSRAKKFALAKGDFNKLKELSKKRIP